MSKTSKGHAKAQECGLSSNNSYQDHANDVEAESALESQLVEMSLCRAVDQNFPAILHRLLSCADAEEITSIVSWQPHGRSFLVKDKHSFETTVLTRWFQQSNMSSFQRQLNLYGFMRLHRGPDKGGYYHELFLRGKPLLCRRIQRVRVKGKGTRKSATHEAEPDLYSYPSLPDQTGSPAPLPQTTNVLPSSSQSQGPQVKQPACQFPSPVSENGTSSERRLSANQAAAYHDSALLPMNHLQKILRNETIAGGNFGHDEPTSQTHDDISLGADDCSLNFGGQRGHAQTQSIPSSLHPYKQMALLPQNIVDSVVPLSHDHSPDPQHAFQDGPKKGWSGYDTRTPPGCWGTQTSEVSCSGHHDTSPAWMLNNSILGRNSFESNIGSFHDANQGHHSEIQGAPAHRTILPSTVLSNNTMGMLGGGHRISTPLSNQYHLSQGHGNSFELTAPQNNDHGLASLGLNYTPAEDSTGTQFGSQISTNQGNTGLRQFFF